MVLDEAGEGGERLNDFFFFDFLPPFPDFSDLSPTDGLEP